jgi:hypothetical protein
MKQNEYHRFIRKGGPRTFGKRQPIRDKKPKTTVQLFTSIPPLLH